MALDLEKYRKKLIEERDRLNQEIGPAVGISEPIPEDITIPSADAPLADETVDVRNAVLDLKTHRLESILAALEGIEDGTYGRCAKCGREIDVQRLDADPAALLCIDDAKKMSEVETPSL